MANRSEAYDFSLFETRYETTMPIREPRREEQREADARRNVVELPEKELKKNAKVKRHPIKAAVGAITFSVFVLLAAGMVFSQEQLAVLTEQINTASQALEEAQSMEVQLNMQAAQKMNGAQVEEYVVNELGMSKITSGQVTYINVAQQDQGTVVQSTEGGSILDRILAAIRSWFA